MPSTDTPTIDMQSRSDVVRLTAILMFVEETHDNDIVRGWAGKLLEQVQTQTQLNDDEVVQQQGDIDRIVASAISEDSVTGD